MKYFIGNWKMFGIPGSIKIVDRINNFLNKDKKNNKKYKTIIAPPHTLLQNFSHKFKNKKISISAQNCFHKDYFGAHTGSISAFMIKRLGVNYVIIGHSENRASGETDYIIKEKVFSALKNNLNIIFCIGENRLEKRKKLTLKVLKKQIVNVLKKNYNLKKIIIAYEPVWSIGTGKVPKPDELQKIVILIKKFLKSHFKNKHNFKILYGGSVDNKSIGNFKLIKELDGFLIGGASKSSKKFIDIIRNFYK
tara:strand:- start:594 stop:1343 length:750 start_codon:yes stop_codon:yes gene_type:complete